MTTPAPSSAASLNGRPLNGKDLEDLPVLSVVLNTELNPHAWQKRIVFTDEGARRHQWFCTTDVDWGETSDRLIAEFGKVILLWLPRDAEIRAAQARADLAV